jgi:ABC-type lipoprotein release transport system permease subunit
VDSRAPRNVGVAGIGVDERMMLEILDRGGASSAVALVVRTQVRRQKWALVLLALAVAVSSAFVMTTAIAARRTATAWNRFSELTKSPELIGQIGLAESPEYLAFVASRRGVEAMTSFMYVAIELEGRDDLEDLGEIGGFTGASPGFGTDIYAPRMIEGRAADPNRADEIVINRPMARVTGLHAGDKVTLVSIPRVIRQTATVTGIGVGPFDFLNGDFPNALLTPAFGSRWLHPYIAAFSDDLLAGYTTAVMARTRAGVDPTVVAAEINAAYPGSTGGPDSLGTSSTTALKTQRNAYLVLAAAAGAAALLALGQAIARRVRSSVSLVVGLSALGLTPRARRACLAAPAIGAVLAGGVLAPVVAWAATALVPTGFARRVEPTPGPRFDPFVLGLGVVTTLAVLSLVAWLGARSGAVRVDMAPLHVHPRMHVGTPAALFGTRVASGWGQRSGRATARSNVIGAVVAVTAATGIATWSAAADHLVATPSRYGWTWDVGFARSDDTVPFADRAASLDAAAQRIVAANAATRLTRGTVGNFSFDAAPGEILEVDPVVGSWWPAVVNGRVPVTDDEVTLSPGMRRAAHMKLGDRITIGSKAFTIVGDSVVPSLANGDPGTTVVMRASAADGIDLDLPQPVLLADLADGVSAERLVALAGDDLEPGTPGAPPNVANLRLIGGLDELLLAVCAILGMAGVAHGLRSATSARRGDHAVMSGLGASRRTVLGSVAWNVAVVGSIGLAIGLPAGLLLGRTVWRRTSSGLNAVPTLWHPQVVAIAVLGGGVIAVVLLTGIIGTRAARTSTPDMLRQQ